MLKGALHVHSTYSDGEFTLRELRDVLLSEGCAFVCMTDHAEYFNEESIRRYVAECELLSDGRFQFVAGLEYRCERNMHILGYGATRPTQSTEPQEVFRHIDAQGAVSVIAHPKDDFFSWIEGFEVLPRGIETWNTKYDGRYAPRPGTFALQQRLRQREPRMNAFYGQDLHWKNQYRGLWVALESESKTPSAILAALAAGKYVGQKDDLQLPASGALPESLLAEFNRAHGRSQQMRRLFSLGKQTLERVGIRVPASLKAGLRRIF